MQKPSGGKPVEKEESVVTVVLVSSSRATKLALLKSASVDSDRRRLKQEESKRRSLSKQGWRCQSKILREIQRVHFDRKLQVILMWKCSQRGL